VVVVPGVYVENVALTKNVTVEAASGIPQASTSLRIMQQLGGSFGSAALFIIVQRQITNRAQAAHGHPGAAGLAEAFGATFWWMLAFTAVLLLPVLFLPGRTKPAPVASQP
jgi:hypothetical protein